MSSEQHALERLRVYVTGACDGLDAVVSALDEHDAVELVGSSAEVTPAAGVLAGGHLDAILHGTSAGHLPAADIAAIREQTRTPILLLAPDESSALLDEALEAEVADLVPLPQPIANVLFAIRKASHARRGGRGAGQALRRGRVVTVFSPKGGTGKTVIATNLAVATARRPGKRVLLLDLDLQFGDVAIMVGVEPEKTIYDLVVAPGELDSEKLAGYVTRHPCGLDVLPAPLRPEDAELVTEAKLGRLLEVARESYDAIVVDTSPFFHGPMLATLDRTDELLLVCGLDVPTLKNVKLSLQTLELLSFPASRVRLVLNRANAKAGLRRKEVEAALGVKVAVELPADRAVPASVNRGEPAALAHGGDFAKSIRKLAEQVFSEQTKERRRILRRLAHA